VFWIPPEICERNFANNKRRAPIEWQVEGGRGFRLVMYAAILTPVAYYSGRTENQFLVGCYVDTSASTRILSEKHEHVYKVR